MFVVRDVFLCKPGHSKSLAERFKKSFPLMQKMKGFVTARVFSASAEFREAMKGYMDEVNGGHREIFKIA